MRVAEFSQEFTLECLPLSWAWCSLELGIGNLQRKPRPSIVNMYGNLQQIVLKKDKQGEYQMF